MAVDDERLEAVLNRSPIPSAPWNEPQAESLKGWWRPVEYFPKKSSDRERKRSRARMNGGRPREVEEGQLIDLSTLRRVREKPDYRAPSLSAAYVQYVKDLPEVTGPLPYSSNPLSGRSR